MSVTDRVCDWCADRGQRGRRWTVGWVSHLKGIFFEAVRGVESLKEGAWALWQANYAPLSHYHGNKRLVNKENRITCFLILSAWHEPWNWSNESWLEMSSCGTPSCLEEIQVFPVTLRPRTLPIAPPGTPPTPQGVMEMDDPLYPWWYHCSRFISRPVNIVSQLELWLVPTWYFWLGSCVVSRPVMIIASIAARPWETRAVLNCPAPGSF